LIPGIGSWAKAVEFAAETTGITLGKPSDFIAKIFSGRLTDNKRVVLVGNEYGSDIVFEQKPGFQTIFVRTGMEKIRTSTMKLDLSLDSGKDPLTLI